MKTYKKIILLVISLIFIGCPLPDQDSDFSVFISNMTKYDIKIYPFSRSRINGQIVNGSKSGEPINIEANSIIEIIQNHIVERGNIYSINNVDSLRIIFDNHKVLVVTCDDLSNTTNCHSLLNQLEFYEINNDDYNMSKECIGTCE